MNIQITSNDLQQKITGYLEELARETDLARKSEEMQKYLDFVARFHNYSPSNIFLIMLAKSDASMVAGFQTWKKMGRYVKKGEHGIPIFAPLIRKEDTDKEDSPKVLSGFRVVYVFDISQTDGEQLPLMPDWKSPEKNAELNEKLIRFAESRGITVTVKDLPGEMQGVSTGGVIEISNTAGSKTIIHEIAHELMHQRENSVGNRAIKEMEAEAVAYVVSKYCQISRLKCPNYISLFGLGHNEIINSMSKILDVSQEIIKSIGLGNCNPCCCVSEIY